MARAKLSVGIDSLSGKLAKKSEMQMRYKERARITSGIMDDAERCQIRFGKILHFIKKSRFSQEFCK